MECIICYEETDLENAYETPCCKKKHNIHPVCYEKCINKYKRCPLCNNKNNNIQTITENDTNANLIIVGFRENCCTSMCRLCSYCSCCCVMPAIILVLLILFIVKIFH